MRQSEQDIANFESKGQTQSGKKGRFHPYERQDKRSDFRKPDRPAWKNIGNTGANRRKVNPKPLTTHRDQPRASSPINDHYFVSSLQEGLLAGSKTLSQDLTLNSINCCVVKVVHSAPGHSQKKEISPGAAACQVSENHKLKYVKGVSCVTHLSCVQPVTNVQIAAQNLPVGVRLQNFWQIWLDLGPVRKLFRF